MKVKLTPEQTRHYLAWDPPAPKPGECNTLLIQIARNGNRHNFREWLLEHRYQIGASNSKVKKPGTLHSLPSQLPDKNTLRLLLNLFNNQAKLPVGTPTQKNLSGTMPGIHDF
jgi:hypothetical protein